MVSSSTVKFYRHWHDFENDCQEILDSIHFGPVINNPSPLDLSISYYHSFSMTENYVIMPMGSLVLDAPSLLQGLINMDSLVDVS